MPGLQASEGGEVSTESGWELWTDHRCGTQHYRVTLNGRDAKAMDPVQLAMLNDAFELIELAFAADTPAALAELRAKRKRGPRRVADLSPNELRGLLARMGSA